jgi:phosphopantothenoylcysteine decarboxylase/phosphopantothenate--cysteine ligase
MIKMKRVVITSGPTVEPIDPVRYISNRSSGKTGFHLANEAGKRGIEEIIFITGPTGFIPEGVTVIKVETALQMREQLRRYSAEAEVIIMAAAVSDYRPAETVQKKIKKNSGALTLHLTENPDLLQELGQRKPPGQILVGFAAETDHILDNARRKFSKKNLDLLILNEISPGNPAFNVDHNQVWFITAEGVQKLETMQKSAIANQTWNQIEELRGT